MAAKHEVLVEIAKAVRYCHEHTNGSLLQNVLGRSGLSHRLVMSVLRTRTDEISALSGLTLTYQQGDGYRPSGNGPFGRYGSRRATYSKPRLYVTNSVNAPE